MALYGIKSSSDIIDVKTIQSACDAIDKAAEDFDAAARKIEDAKEYASGDNLKVDGKTMEESFDIVKGAHENIKKNILEFTNSIRATANSIYVAQSQELAEYQAQQQSSNQ